MNSAALRRWASFPNLLSAGFFVLLLAQVSNHIMWRDELRTWQVTREATGLVSLWHLTRYEGVPVLWYWLVFLLTRFTDNAFLMQFVHACIATAVVYVVARWAPFSRLNKTLFTFGYFPFFEYATITRNYSLVFLFVMIACALISMQRIRWLTLAGVLFLLMQVSIWGAGLASLLFLAAVAKAWTGPREDRPGVTRVGIAGAALVLGAVCCVLAILPGPGASYSSSWWVTSWDMRIYHSIGSIYRACVPIPRLGLHFWNTNILDRVPAIQAVLGLILLIGAAGSLVRRPIALMWMLLAVTALVGFALLYFGSLMRHDGMLFIVLIAALWLASAVPKWDIPASWGGNLFQRLERMLPKFLSILLAISAVGGLIAAASGMLYPFSATRAVASYVRANIEPTVTLAAFRDYCASPIAYWLDRSFFSISTGEDTYVNTQDDRQRLDRSIQGTAELINPVYQLLLERPGPVLLMLNSGVALTHDGPIVRFSPGPGQPMRFLRVVDIVDPAFERGVVKDENHKLYMVYLHAPIAP